MSGQEAIQCLRSFGFSHHFFPSLQVSLFSSFHDFDCSWFNPSITVGLFLLLRVLLLNLAIYISRKHMVLLSDGLYANVLFIWEEIHWSDHSFNSAVEKRALFYTIS